MFAIGRLIGSVLAAIALAGSAVAQDAALETRLGEKDFESPPASLDQLDWLVGQWVGDGIQGAPAMESWLPPTGGTMVGTFVQETSGGEIMFTEHLYLMQENGTLALRLKHFNADLTAWEEKDDMLTFRLVALEPCAAYFHALTLRCADSDRPGEGLVAAVRMQSDKPEVQELVFRFERPSEREANSCPDASTTLDLNQCFADRLTVSEERRAAYLAAATEREAANPLVLEQIRGSEKAFEVYRDSECGAVWESWKEGTIRTMIALGCQIELTDRRTHTIWRNWLTYMDSSAPVLPAPLPTR
ncbi:MAG: DUF6265 family protein [Pseudomonadota bacterium]